jgi:hypothetical protein
VWIEEIILQKIYKSDEWYFVRATVLGRPRVDANIDPYIDGMGSPTPSY